MLTPQIADKGVTKHILRSFGLHASRRLGQNFLISPAVVRGVVEAAEIGQGDHVLEIGPGIGTLTQG
ncbi:MAG: 16S rRNA (adenine(1518)-N(6)/adenine(1519)-N(6))-dimethyltransferase, partial [Schwartzia sp.]|nr:16S rRNA (adenine(1518)-N(6)/adenine(1519)-N(6))-dimethyltransferase [Schwartzia sp. (in: firmicutes)]